MQVDQEKLEDELSKLRESTQRPNILLAGGTGVGKSSLINHIFGKTIAPAGTGKPITQNIEKYEDGNSKVVIFDSKGYEIGSQQEADFINDIIGLCKNEKEISNQIHIVWYLIQASGSRVTEFDIEAIKRIKKEKKPIAVLFTKSDNASVEDSKLLKLAITEKLPDTPCFDISIKKGLPEAASSDFQLQLLDLVAWTHDQLPGVLRAAFIAQQEIDLTSKRDKAINIVQQHATGAAATGFIPIPGSDAPLLLANQYALLARVLYLFGLDNERDKYSLIIKAAMAQLLPTIGKWGAAQLIKMVPGIGSLVGGIINAAVAATLTTAFGLAMVETVYHVRNQRLKDFAGEPSISEGTIEKFFIESLNTNIRGTL